MGLFSKILNKLGIGKKDDKEPTAGATASAPPKTAGKAAPASAKPAGPVKPTSPAKPPVSMPSAYASSQPSKPAAVAPMAEVDVLAKLEALAKGKKGLDWKVSIVDLLKLLDIDSSREAREELAKELGCPTDLMSDSAKMNVWLHKTVLKKIAENGGNIPKDLLD